MFLCEELRQRNRYSMIGEGFKGLKSYPTVTIETTNTTTVTFEAEIARKDDKIPARNSVQQPPPLNQNRRPCIDKPLPPLPEAPREFLGVVENRLCTLLRLETIEAFRVYCQRDFRSFMESVHQHKNLITLDIRNNLNRGPIFSAGMVAYALQKLIESSLNEYLPYEDLKYVRDIMFHYLANRNLRFHRFKWRPRAFDTRDFNAMNYLDDEYCDGFFKEMQGIIRRGYGETEQERVKSGAAVTAILYVSCLTAMDTADKDNAHHAQNLVTAVTIAYMASEALVLAAPVPKATYFDNYLLKPLSTEITNKIENRYTSGALRSAIETTFRDTYVIGALQGRRIPGMRLLPEDSSEISPKKRKLGKEYLGHVRMFVEALGETWPRVRSHA
jgi:hypothetical protein